MLARGDRFPHLSIEQIDGTTFLYGDIWQRRNLVLISLAGDDRERDAAYLARLAVHDAAFRAYETAVVATRDRIAGLPAPAALVADRWGEIVAVETARDVTALPAPGDLLEWIRFVAHACPECEGEAR